MPHTCVLISAPPPGVAGDDVVLTRFELPKTSAVGNYQKPDPLADTSVAGGKQLIAWGQAARSRAIAYFPATSRGPWAHRFETKRPTPANIKYTGDRRSPSSAWTTLRGQRPSSRHAVRHRT
eukprot:3927854-Prymnesium_polylepis.1